MKPLIAVELLLVVVGAVVLDELRGCTENFTNVSHFAANTGAN
jgi:hypothetical protein